MFMFVFDPNTATNQSALKSLPMHVKASCQNEMRLISRLVTMNWARARLTFLTKQNMSMN